MSNYSLDIISQHSDFVGKKMRKYHVDQIDTIGAWGNEPFSIEFKNHTLGKVQVKISIDGTDILTGKPADTEVNSDMWMVQAYGSLNIKCWPENLQGGAKLVFTSAENSVALHTHGDLSHRGIIAAAVFIEGQPAQYINYNYHYHYPKNPFYDSWIVNTPSWIVNTPIWIGNTYGSFTQTVNLNSTSRNVMNSNDTYFCSNNAGGLTDNPKSSEDLQSLVAVGAGEHVEQKISHVPGLVKPLFSEVVRVRYLWWDQLKEKLQSMAKNEVHASGFPASNQINFINLGATPRLTTETKCDKNSNKENFSRF